MHKDFEVGLDDLLSQELQLEGNLWWISPS